MTAHDDALANWAQVAVAALAGAVSLLRKNAASVDQNQRGQFDTMADYLESVADQKP